MLKQNISKKHWQEGSKEERESLIPREYTYFSFPLFCTTALQLPAFGISQLLY